MEHFAKQQVMMKKRDVSLRIWLYNARKMECVWRKHGIWKAKKVWGREQAAGGAEEVKCASRMCVGLRGFARATKDASNVHSRCTCRRRQTTRQCSCTSRVWIPFAPCAPTGTTDRRIVGAQGAIHLLSKQSKLETRQSKLETSMSVMIKGQLIDGAGKGKCLIRTNHILSRPCIRCRVYYSDPIRANNRPTHEGFRTNRRECTSAQVRHEHNPEDEHPSQLALNRSYYAYIYGYYLYSGNIGDQNKVIEF